VHFPRFPSCPSIHLARRLCQHRRPHKLRQTKTFKMPGGRTHKNDYDWDDKKDVCYQLFVVEKKSLNEIIAHFANHFGVAENELPR